jgi:iron complex transport system substrate-binding protein
MQWIQKVRLSFFIGLLSFNSWAICKSDDFKPVPLKYAKHFKLFKKSDSWVLNLGQNNLLISKNKVQSCAKDNWISPAKNNRLAVLSTNYIAYLDQLNSLEKVVAVETNQYISSPRYQKIKKNVAELGRPVSFEKLIAKKPTLVLSYDYQGQGKLLAKRLKSFGIQTLLLSDFKEAHPLARAEYLKLIGILVGKYQEGFDDFNKIESNYLSIKKLAKNKPRVPLIIGGIVGGSWLTSSLKGDINTIIKDAGGVRILKELVKASGTTLNLEQLLSKKWQPQVWLSQNMWISKKNVLKADGRHKLLSFWNRIDLWNYTKNSDGGSGIDYWERGQVRVDLVISDLYQILHEQGKGNLNFYQRLK